MTKAERSEIFFKLLLLFAAGYFGVHIIVYLLRTLELL
jgi:hypothetical protein